MDSLEILLNRLETGDDEAAQQVFIDYEPYLRKVVRRMLPAELRSKFDSIDIVQSVWGDVLSRFREGGMRFESAAQLRAFLLKATRNRFVDRVRQHRTAVRIEQPISHAILQNPPQSPSPHASEVAIANELWQRLLAASPQDHRPILELRAQGNTLMEIAKQTGLHEGSVRRILRNLALKVAGETATEAETENI